MAKKTSLNEEEMKEFIKKLKIGKRASHGDDEYYRGMRNGIEWVLTILEDRDPQFEKDDDEH